MPEDVHNLKNARTKYIMHVLGIGSIKMAKNNMPATGDLTIAYYPDASDADINTVNPEYS